MYQIMLMVTLFVLYCFDLVEYYKMFITAGVSIAFVYTSNSTNSMVYYSKAQTGAAAAGFILLSMINLLWVIYFGGDNASPTNRWIDSFSLQGIRPSILETSMAVSRSQRLNSKPQYPYQYQEDQGSASVHDGDQNDNMYGHELQSTKYVSSTVLNGFENTDLSSSKRVLDLNNAPNTGTLNTQATGTFITDTTNANTDTTMGCLLYTSRCV